MDDKLGLANDERKTRRAQHNWTTGSGGKGKRFVSTATRERRCGVRELRNVNESGRPRDGCIYTNGCRRPLSERFDGPVLYITLKTCQSENASDVFPVRRISSRRYSKIRTPSPPIRTVAIYRRTNLDKRSLISSSADAPKVFRFTNLTDILFLFFRQPGDIFFALII